jgi:Spy/CpxP family protein refolding chaperone
MKTWVITTVVAAMLATATWAAPGQGQCGGGGGKDKGGPGGGPGGGQGLQAILKDEQLAKQLGMTDAQIEAVHDAAYANRKDSVKLRGDAELARIDLHKLMEADTPDLDAVMKAVEKSGAAETALHKSEIALKLKIREIVGADTMKKIRAHMREVAGQKFQDRRNGPPGRGPGGPQGQGPGPMSENDEGPDFDPDFEI